MVGTSGGGFDLMTEAISLSGMAEIPLVIYLAQRPGPSTGIPTYTAQGDLNVARYSGHGEFSRFIVAPGDSKEAEELTSQCFYFSQKFKIPSIILTDKHIAESFYTLNEKAKITKSEKSTVFKRCNSYEHNPDGEMIDDIKSVKKAVESRIKKAKDIEKEAEKFNMFNVYGKGNNLIVSWGSTKGAILDAISDLDVKFLQILYLDPFPDIKKELEKAKNIIVIENNSTSPLSGLIAEKTGVFVNDKILRYDGRPFLHDELKEEIKKKIK